MRDLEKIGFGGGCHWCTEAVFQALKGVRLVEQGYISVHNESETFYEGVNVHFDPEMISLKKLIQIHLQTHNSSSDHSMRFKYLSAIYTFTEHQSLMANKILNYLKDVQEKEFITKVYAFGAFKKSRKEIRNYYRTDPQRPFCKVYIDPKLKILRENFANYLESNY